MLPTKPSLESGINRGAETLLPLTQGVPVTPHDISGHGGGSIIIWVCQIQFLQSVFHFYLNLCQPVISLAK